MLAKTRKLRHPLGTVFDTPLLIPSFSSKGFGFDKDGKSEIRGIFEVASEYLTDIMLVSAYDLAYGNLEPLADAVTEMIVVDSGGYELSAIHDLSAVYHLPVLTKDWTLEQLIDLYDKWPKHVPATFVSFDRPDLRLQLRDQIKAARNLFSRYREQMNTFLIKPESEEQRYLQITNIVAMVDELGGFDIIGFTEKELGNSVLERMNNISNVRLAMDRSGVEVPIHVYGSLDPLTTPLYFLAGAEIFDGLAWLRYGFVDGVACYYENYGERRVGIHRTDDFVKAKTIQDNLSYLLELKHQMGKFVLTRSFDEFGPNAHVLGESYKLLRTMNRGIE